MINNIKVDLIYYTIGTDFEMEFNLCGCCRMRLLTDAISSRSEFAKSLARGVSRSNIIIACGPIFGEKGLVSTVAKVTNIGVETIENNRYGIEDDKPINILKGSTPLVASNGIFGGCIIENGSQVIILLTESKSLRKTIMKELIHPYISQRSIGGAPNQNSYVMPPVSPASPVSPTISVTLDDENISLDEEPEKNQRRNVDECSEYILDNAFDYEQDGESLNDGQHDNYGVAPFGHENAVERQNLKYYLNDYDNNPITQPKPRNGILVFLILLAAIVALLILYFAVIRPLINGYEIIPFLKEALTPHTNYSL